MNSCRALLAALLLAASPAWAINKCKGPDGKVSFQDAPCTGQGEKIEVHPASGYAAPATAAAPGQKAAAPASQAQKEGVFGESWQRRTYLENRGVPDARAAIDNHQRQCDAKQAALAQQKRYTNNNLAGATLDQAISTEMQAAATLCDSRRRELRDQLTALEKELHELQARQP
jgi:hypothetical protein